MNREIKFRAFDNENKYMVTSKQGVFTALRNSMNIVRQNDGYYNDGDLLKPNKEKYTLMQYTGLDGKNGKEIYEGDIVKYENMTGKIMFFNGSFILSDLEETEEWELGVINEEVEIIGNIYDNPELLGGE